MISSNGRWIALDAIAISSIGGETERMSLSLRGVTNGTRLLGVSITSYEAKKGKATQI